jgi:integrase/recombinase XerC
MLRSFVSAANRVGLVDWALKLERYSDIPVKVRKAAKRRNMAGPPPEEIVRLRESLRAEGTLSAKRDLAILALAENPALRRSEIAALDIGDVDVGVGEITIVGKGRLEPEEMPLVPEVLEDIRPWLEARRGAKSSPLFVRIRKTVMTEDRLSDHAIWEIALKRGWAAKLKKRLRPHGLRHAGITAIAEVIASEGIPISEGMKLSRHRKAETFQAYVDKVEGRGRQILSKAARRIRSAG